MEAAAAALVAAKINGGWASPPFFNSFIGECDEAKMKNLVHSQIPKYLN